MAKDTKVMQVMMVDATPEAIGIMRESLEGLKKKLPFDAEFIITNEKVEFKDVKYLIDELFKLYKMEKKNGKK